MIRTLTPSGACGKSEEKQRLSRHAQAILRVLRREWEMSTVGPARRIGREGPHARSAKGCRRAQAAMIVVPSEVCYQPKFTYIWTLGVGRFPDALRRRVRRETALRERSLAAFSPAAGMTFPGEMARVTGLSRPEAGRGNRAWWPRATQPCLRRDVSPRGRRRQGELTLF